MAAPGRFEARKPKLRLLDDEGQKPANYSNLVRKLQDE